MDQEGRITAVVEEKTTEKTARKVKLAFRQVSFRSHGAVLLLGIHLSLTEGGSLALVGPSGAGKSTLLRLVNRLFDPGSCRQTGRILLDGQPVERMDPVQLRRRIGMLPQRPVPFPMSVFDNVAFPLRIRGVRERELLKRRVERSLRQAGLWGEVRRRLAEPAACLSGGQLQRLALARTLVGEPEMLLLDEPTSALDPASREGVWEALSALRGRLTLLLVTHSPEEAGRLADRTALLVAGRIVEEGPTGEFLAHPHTEAGRTYLAGTCGTGGLRMPERGSPG